MTTHPRWGAQPATLAATPLRFNSPDFTGRGDVVDLLTGEPGDALVRVMWQDPDRVALLSDAAPGTVAGALRALAADTLREHAYTGRTAREAWDAILAQTWHTPPREVDLATFVAAPSPAT